MTIEKVVLEDVSDEEDRIWKDEGFDPLRGVYLGFSVELDGRKILFDVDVRFDQNGLQIGVSEKVRDTEKGHTLADQGICGTDAFWFQFDLQERMEKE